MIARLYRSELLPLALCTATALAVLLTPALVRAEPFIPDDRDQVVASLSTAVVGLSQQLRATESAQTTTDTNQLTQRIFSAYTLAANTQETRAYGRVMTLLQQWPEGIKKPALIHLISAAVLQHNHSFQQALTELDHVLAVNALDAQAHMIRAQIGLVTGDYALTQQSCDLMQGIVSPAIHLNCQSQLDGVTGRAAPALNAVTHMLDNNPALLPSDRTELQITAAVLAHRLEQDSIAENHYLSVLLRSPQHFYTLVHYGNFLLEHNRPQDLIRLIEIVPEEMRNTEINVLLAQALVATDSDRAGPLVAKLNSDFELAFLRDEGLPHKEYARYALTVLNQPGAALQSARQNWLEQKEPSDALLLARAAAAVADHQQLSELQQWIKARGTQYNQLDTIFAEQGIQ
ncbi:MAG: hypothetical protein KKD00_04730 [Gammaproteobacteria bacterium]|nr:hypothetical protein [Gammaproteobacteria bacterium]